MLIGFNQNNVSKLIDSIIGQQLDPTVSICHQCHRHIPGWKYKKDNAIYLAKSCPIHGISHHMIESDAEFYSSLSHVYNHTRLSFDGGIIVETTDRCNLECPHCYHLPDNKIKDRPLEDLISEYQTMPKEISTIVLCGAETTLRSDLIELISSITNINLKPIIMTNGIRYSDRQLLEKSIEAGLILANIGLNHPTYINNETIRKKQLECIDNCQTLGVLGDISYTIIDFDEIPFIIDEITTRNWSSDIFRIRCGSEIGRNATSRRVYLSDLVKEVESYCKLTSKEFKLELNADNNIYHQMVWVNDKFIRLIQWCDETDIDMEELRTGPWCNFVPGPISNFLHMAIRRDVWKNQGFNLPDHPPSRYHMGNTDPHDKLDLLNIQ